MTISRNSPLKVSEHCKDLIRYASAIFRLTQGDLVERALVEYIQNHQAEFDQRHTELSELVKALSRKPLEPAGS